MTYRHVTRVRSRDTSRARALIKAMSLSPMFSVGFALQSHASLRQPCTLSCQWQIQKFGIGGGRVGWSLGMPPPQKIFLTLMQKSAFSCKIFTCFQMHPVNRGGRPPRPLDPPLFLAVRSTIFFSSHFRHVYNRPTAKVSDFRHFRPILSCPRPIRFVRIRSHNKVRPTAILSNRKKQSPKRSKDWAFVMPNA